jgi:N utilization substance protein B
MTEAGKGAGGTPRPGTTDPRRSRQRALKILFQADLRSQDPRDSLAAIMDDPHAAAMLDDVDADEAPVFAGAGVDDYTVALVHGVAEHRDEIDGLIEKFARRWTVARMPVVDRNVLRLGAYELLHEELSSAVVIDEALEMAKALSTDNSARFVNGVLESVRRWHEDTSSRG